MKQGGLQGWGEKYMASFKSGKQMGVFLARTTWTRFPSRSPVNSGVPTRHDPSAWRAARACQRLPGDALQSAWTTRFTGGFDAISPLGFAVLGAHQLSIPGLPGQTIYQDIFQIPDRLTVFWSLPDRPGLVGLLQVSIEKSCALR